MAHRIGIYGVMLAFGGWCEMRNDFRHFRTDKIKELVQLDSTYSESRTVLLKKNGDSKKGSARRKSTDKNCHS